MFQIVLSLEETDEAGVLVDDPEYHTVAAYESKTDAVCMFDQFKSVTAGLCKTVAAAKVVEQEEGKTS